MNEIPRSFMKSSTRPSRFRIGCVLFFCVGVLSASPVRPSDPGAPAPSATLGDLLAHARKSVDAFWNQFRSVTCVETVTQEKLGKQGKVEYRQRSSFDYLALLNIENNDLLVEESRLQQTSKDKPKNIPLLVTSGLPTLLLVFHPNYQEGFRYQLEGEEVAGGQKLVKIRFRHVPGARSTTALRLRNKNYPLEIQGIAWLDPETGTIHRIAAEIAAPMSDINLKRLEMDVSYAPCEFPEGIHWLPSAATVDVQTERQHWHNLHQYSHYKVFMVNTEDKISR